MYPSSTDVLVIYSIPRFTIFSDTPVPSSLPISSDFLGIPSEAKREITEPKNTLSVRWKCYETPCHQQEGDMRFYTATHAYRTVFACSFTKEMVCNYTILGDWFLFLLSLECWKTIETSFLCNGNVILFTIKIFCRKLMIKMSW